MIEEIYEKLNAAYESHKIEFHKDCPKIFKQKDGQILCQKLNTFEEWIQHFYEEKLFKYLDELAEANDREKFYYRSIEKIKAKFIEGNHRENLKITSKSKGTRLETYTYNIEHEYIGGFKAGEIDVGIQVNIAHAFASLKLYNYLLENKPEGLIQSNLIKMNWKGSQKQLAELFVELHNKGWIEKIEPNTIQKVFTNTKSIKQYLKPSQTKENSYISTYEQLYGPEYIPTFHNIKPSTKS